MDINIMELRDVEFSITPCGVAVLTNQIELVRKYPFARSLRKIELLKKLFVRGENLSQDEREWDAFMDCIVSGFVTLSDESLMEEIIQEKIAEVVSISHQC
jgi:hypothetical protein